VTNHPFKPKKIASLLEAFNETLNLFHDLHWLLKRKLLKKLQVAFEIAKMKMHENKTKKM
jgi:hypothetical protein